MSRLPPDIVLQCAVLIDVAQSRTVPSWLTEDGAFATILRRNQFYAAFGGLPPTGLKIKYTKRATIEPV